MRFEYSAGAFVYKMENGRPLFLVLGRAKGRRGKAGTPDMPKGHIEKGENAEQAARREIEEETGISPSLIPYFKEKTTYFFRDDGETVNKDLTLFIAYSGSQKVRISSEHNSYAWLDYDSFMQTVPFKDILALMPKVNTYIKRWEEMKELNDEYARLPSREKNWKLSRTLVRGEGRLDAELVLLGQAPGRNEDIQGRPFIGRGGKLLDTMLKKGGINRNEAYITSVVQFFPPENRMPSSSEIALCRPFLIRQFSIIRPGFVVLLGDLASKSMLGVGEVRKNHGKRVEKDGITYIIMFHPAAALRSTGTLRIMEQDFKEMGKKLGGRLKYMRKDNS